MSGSQRGIAGPALLVHVVISRYGDHLPLYRQSEIYARQGVDLGRSALAGKRCIAHVERPPENIKLE